MALVPFVVIALIGATIHRHRDKQPRSTARTLEIYLIWWLVVAVGIAGLFGAMYHFFDGPATAREIGYTNGDGGFQTEVGFGDLALSVLAILCIWFRDRFVLATVIALSIMYLGDAYGHIHQEAIHDNHDPDNTGAVLYLDILLPLVAIGLYALRERALRLAPARAGAASPSPG